MKHPAVMISGIAILVALGGQLSAGSDVGTPLSEVGKPVAEESLARVVSPRKSEIAADMDGIISRIDVLEGQAVTQGEMLFVFDCRSAKLALKRSALSLKVSEETLQSAKSAHDRSNLELSNSTVSKAQNDASNLAYVTSQLDVSDKQLAQAAAQLAVEYCSVIAPFTGVVTGIHTGPGSYVTAGTPVLSLTETENLEVVAQLTPDEIDWLSNSTDLTFVSSDEIFHLKVRTIEPVFDSATKSQRVILDLPPSADLPVGLTGVLRWYGGRYRLPTEFLVRQGPDVGLQINTGNGIAFHPLPGAIEGLPVLLNLPSGTKVIKP